MNVATGATNEDSGGEFFRPGDRVRIRTGAFENYEGIVAESFPEKDLIRVSIQIFGRPTTVEISSEGLWEIEAPE